mgnify:CR=1 FL=1
MMITGFTIHVERHEFRPTPDGLRDTHIHFKIQRDTGQTFDFSSVLPPYDDLMTRFDQMWAEIGKQAKDELIKTIQREEMRAHQYPGAPQQRPPNLARLFREAEENKESGDG